MSTELQCASTVLGAKHRVLPIDTSLKDQEPNPASLWAEQELGICPLSMGLDTVTKGNPKPTHSAWRSAGGSSTDTWR